MSYCITAGFTCVACGRASLFVEKKDVWSEWLCKSRKSCDAIVARRMGKMIQVRRCYELAG